MTSSPSVTGLGNNKALLNVYIENIPPLEQYQTLSTIQALVPGEIHQIAQLTGNHWRKIFNVFAKLCFELAPLKYQTWQQYRDQELLQSHSNQCLYFTPFQSLKVENSNEASVTLIMGKTYANKLNLAEQCYWLNEYFAINQEQRLIICPYFDYRQLSNIKISQLAVLIKQLQN
ncbi:DUF6942 family protein [Thalassotalea sp. PLHSN55]|uniref:DUF6942 family protein n=1 Tax=Thalassotalea sp. PLHSN55 TaxID=3435888 RepID=UPI003F87D86C